MSLPLKQLVDVSISVAPTLAPLAGFGEILFLTNSAEDLKVISAAERVRRFGQGEVEQAFPSNSECVRAANTFFAQNPQPSQFTVGVMSLTASAGSLVGGEHYPLEDLKTISNDAVKVTVDGTEYTATLTLGTATSLTDVATKITEAIGDGTKAKVTYSGGKFVVTSATTGTSSTVSFFKDADLGRKVPDADFELPLKDNLAVRSAATNASYMLGLSQAKALRLVSGAAPDTVSSALSKCKEISSTFVAVATHKGLRDNEQYVSGADGAAVWCQANNKIFLNTTNDYNIFDLQAQAQTQAGKLKAKSLSKTITTYGADSDEYPSVSLFGRIATVNYEGTNTVINLKFKKLPTITALNLTTGQKSAMDKVNVGGFMDFGGNLMYAEGRMADNGWLDTVHGLMWLQDRVQKGVFNLMYGTTTKIPYTDVGVDMVEQKVATALEQGVANGLIGAGFTPEGEFLPNGWKIISKSATEVAAEDKSNRLYRGLQFIAIGAGALNNVVISGSFSE